MLARTSAIVGLVFALSLPLISQDKAPCQSSGPGASPPRNYRKMHFEQRPPFSVEEIGQGRTLLTNSYQEPLTAIVVDSGPLPKTDSRMLQALDALISTGLIAPIPRGLSFVTGLPRVIAPGAEEPKIVAALWEDGSTFGPSDALDRIYQGRRGSIQQHDELIALLKRSLSEKWTSQQLLAAIEVEERKPSKPTNIGRSSGSLYGGLSNTIRVNTTERGSVQGQAGFERFLTHLIDYYQSRREVLTRGLLDASESPR